MPSSEEMSSRPRFIMLGGFLGAGKTTTLLRLAQYLQRTGKRVGIITNDQAEGLVDTELAKELNLPVKEIAGGCFCCRTENLVDALERLTKESQPDVFIAEPVGSCTDLVATVSLPLERIYQVGFQMAPYAVLLDPYRAMQTLAVEGGEPLFTPDVCYIFRKQLEEAEIIVVNKADVMPPTRMARLRETLTREYPAARLMIISSREGVGLEPLFIALETGHAKVHRVMEMDYERYGAGESLLGWYNGKATVRAKRPGGMNGNEWLLDLAKRIQSVLRAANVEIAHLKMTLCPTNIGKMSKRRQNTAQYANNVHPAQVQPEVHLSQSGDLAAVSLVRTEGEPELRRELKEPLCDGSLTLNLRAEGAPEVLATVVEEALKNNASVVSVRLIQAEAFRPGQPTPTHRVVTVG